MLVNYSVGRCGGLGGCIILRPTQILVDGVVNYVVDFGTGAFCSTTEFPFFIFLCIFNGFSIFLFKGFSVFWILVININVSGQFSIIFR